MYRILGSALLLSAIFCVPRPGAAQGDPARPVAGGGISAPGWKGVIDANEWRRE